MDPNIRKIKYSTYMKTISYVIFKNTKCSLGNTLNFPLPIMMEIYLLFKNSVHLHILGATVKLIQTVTGAL